jgi:type II secretory pathway component GspD/PulD (secretin)
MSTRTLLITLLASALALPALAQEAAPAPAPAEPAVSVEGAAPTESSVSRDRDTLSVDFPDEDVKTILRNVADLFELNLVVPDTLTGKTSIKLRDVTWRQIFQVVLAPVGYTYIEEGNIIKIVSNDSLAMEPVSTDVFIINNAKAEDLRPTVAGLIDSAAGGKIEINTRSNALIITERPSRMGRIRAIIEQLDKATAQVMIESQFVEVTDRDVRNIGVNWASLQGMQFGVGGMTQTWNRSRGQTQSSGGNLNNSNATTATTGNTSTNSSGSTSGTTSSTTNGTTGTTNTTNTSTNTTAFNVNPTNLDVNTGSFGNATLNLPSGNVTNIPASVPGDLAVQGFTPFVPAAGTTPATPASFTSPVTNSTSISSGSTSGTNSSTSTGSSSGTSNSITDTISGGLTNTASSVFNDLMSLTNTGGTNRLSSAVFSASDFNIIVSALKSQNNTKVVSNPTVVTLNNTEAVLNIGSEFPIPSYTYNSERGTFEVSGFQYKPIGIIMKVTPQVNAQGTIRLSLEPEVSQQNGETTFGGAGGATIPIIATRKVKTNISLKDGYTAGIGGLVTSNKNHGGTKVPVLGDIPLLGRLFSSKSVNDQSTNLLIFITAKTVNPDGAAPSDVFTDDALQSVGMADAK